MSINRIDFGVIAASNEVSHVKAAEDSRPLMDRQNFQTQFNEEVDNQKNSVNQKDDVGQGEMNSDAQEKGSNEYMGDGGRNRKGSKEEKNPILERQLSVEKMEKMAGNMMDRNGKPVDLRLSSGFDLKI
ncbi:hypothetical protein [Butyrivibrio sp.]|jgi:hypothetical protein|uniref:hypothetical protein n=1 Tax=Butyrivibrio sp. TaxID=28121 RepID=UPI001B64B559|nr:hypothetical protein [Butyrivibrio sp.]MBP3816742.1 hypothetical protein [Butyrivibrio sp.]MBQ6416691.1 hypothetical protein [Butyrivibrio sp.]MBQ9301913.1 hypothetical protein [Butyrivibrio sp.]